MVTSSYPLFDGDGTAPFIEEIARSVVARGHQVDMVLPAHPKLKRAEEPGLRFFPFSYAPVPSVGRLNYQHPAWRAPQWRVTAVRVTNISQGPAPSVKRLDYLLPA